MLRIIVMILIPAFLYSLLGSLWKMGVSSWTTDMFIYSLIMSFFFIIVPLSIAVFVFYLIFAVFKWRANRWSVTTQIVTLLIIFNLTVLLFNLPDFVRHQTSPNYNQYHSFREYFIRNLLEGIITATLFSIVIPLLNNFLIKNGARLIRPHLNNSTQQ